MKSLVETFGGAVTHLEKTFETLEFPKIKKWILKYIKDNPEDSETRIAWDTYSRGSRNTCRRRSQPAYVWYAEDLATGKRYEGMTSKKLGEQIGATQYMINFAYEQRRLTRGRYKITRKLSEFRSPRPPKFTWIAEDTIAGELIAAGTALALANKIGSTEGRVVVYRKKGKMLDDRYKITREDNRKAQ